MSAVDLAADNKRLRLHMARIIAEREIASEALRHIAFSYSDADPIGVAQSALDRMMALPHADPRP